MVAPPNGRAWPATFIQVDTLYVYGGLTNSGPAKDAYTYDLKAMKWTVLGNVTNAPPARYGASIVALQNRAVLFGGTSGNTYYDDTWQFVVESSCLGKACEDCTKDGTTGCGWCSGNPNDSFKCVAGDSGSSFVAASCQSGGMYTNDIDQCPEAFPSYAIALIVIGGVVLVGIIIFAIMKVRSNKNDYQEIS